ncbi:MAG TPA: hypothetical protein VF771_05330 [Longimicrobiaceae bacterium]
MRSRASSYHAIGRALLETAKALDVIAEPKYGNGLGIIAVHAAIAYTDALTVAYRELKSVSGDHTMAADLLEHALGRRADPAQLKRLRYVLDAKTHVSYGGSYYTLDEGRELLVAVTRYSTWAEDMLASRPA